ncbi:MAG: thiamine-monophosphate kinase [Planctomycetes bacterium]|nr:thiamine-monophosphate kinase [Planctomycetota bacterium]
MADERAFTAGLGRFFGTGRGVLCGIGDDAAVVRNPAPNSVLCCDPVVEGVHFTRATPLRLVGRKAVNRNLADLAAMGAVPDWLLLSLVLPSWCGPRQRRELLHGVRAAARAAGAIVVGGDVAATPGPLVATVTAIGHAEGRVLTRSGARAGDTVHVTGPLGGSSLGQHLRFRPPLPEGAWLAAQRCVHAAMDVSDGFLLDLQTLLDASGGLGAEIDAAAVPIARAARRLANGDADLALRHALGDGEDHVLLWTQRRGADLPAGGPLAAAARRPIGKVLAEPGLFLRREGCRIPVPALGYRHELADRR